MYCVNDFEESLKLCGLQSPVVKVLRAWGRAEEPDVCCHNWSGGFLMELKDGRFAYLTGWCDYTGWGCQDGSEIVYADTLAALDISKDADENWDDAPADLNKWLIEGMKPWEERS